MDDVDLASAAKLIGDSSRAAILTALLDGRALTAGELARIAKLAPATASGHLGKLLDGGLVTMVAQGRHRYYRLAGPEIGQALESLAFVSRPAPVVSLRTSAAARALRPARLCYDHLAGELGVRIHDHLVATSAVVVGADGLLVSDAGAAWFLEAGVDVAAARARRRPLLRPCLDWTERRPHLAGSLAAALARALLDQGWLARRAAGERGLTITQLGRPSIDALLSSEFTRVPASG